MNQKFCVVLCLALVLAAAQPAPAVEIVPPSPGDTSVTITGLTLPVPPTGSSKRAGESKSWAVMLRNHLSGGEMVAEYYYLVGNESQITADLYSAAMSGDVYAAIDIWAGLWATASLKKQATLTVEIEGFSAGSSEFRITGLPEGQMVEVIDSVPGRWPVSVTRQDGGFSDQDGVANGVLSMAIFRDNPPYVVPGEVLIVTTTGEGGGAMQALAASGDAVRYVVPAVSHIVGSSGIPFISDLSISNPFGEHADGWIRFVREGESPDGAPSAAFHLEPGASVAWADVLQSALGVQENVKGSLLIGGTPNWILAASSRNYAEDTQGKRYGIAVPALSTLSAMTESAELNGPWIIPGLKEDASSRSNLILTGAVPQSSDVLIQIVAGGAVLAEETRTVPGYGLLQINHVSSVLGVAGDVEGYVRLEINSGAVVGGLSVVDGTADDASFILPQKMMP